MRAENIMTRHSAARAHQPGSGFRRMRGTAMVRPLGEFCLPLNRAMRLPDSPSCNHLVVSELLPVKGFFGVPKRFLCRVHSLRNAMLSLGSALFCSFLLDPVRECPKMNSVFAFGTAAAAAAGGAIAYGTAWPRAQLFGSTICRTNSARKLAITPKLLDLLDRYTARATFFLIGRFVRESAELVRETVARGHVVGNHTETHPNLFRLAPMQIRVELRLCHSAISNAI